MKNVNTTKQQTIEMEESGISKVHDFYESEFFAYEDLLNDVIAMEDNSRWVPGISTKDIRIADISELDELTAKNTLPPEAFMDTVTIGTKLKVTVGTDEYCVRSSAMASIYTRASIAGAALGRMTPYNLSIVLNKCFDVAKSNCLMLIRYDKASAFHSDASDGYMVMPISMLLEKTRNALKKFGHPEFVSGYNSHTYTVANWVMPEASEKMSNRYAEILKDKIGPKADTSIIPGLRFSSSDTASCSAIAQPMFCIGNSAKLRLANGVQVKHIKSSSDSKKAGMELYTEQVETSLFTKFYDCMEQAGRLSKIPVYHAENVVVGICNDTKIPRKYGDIARENVVLLAHGYKCISAYDVFLAFSQMLQTMEDNAVSTTTQSVVEEKVFKTMNPAFDWKKYDVGGVVAWSGTATKDGAEA